MIFIKKLIPQWKHDTLLDLVWIFAAFLTPGTDLTTLLSNLYIHHYIAALPYDNMGVNLAGLTMSVFCYPMGATIGCGLQNAKTHFPQKHTLFVQKHNCESLQRVTRGWFPSTCVYSAVTDAR